MAQVLNGLSEQDQARLDLTRKNHRLLLEELEALLLRRVKEGSTGLVRVEEHWKNGCLHRFNVTEVRDFGDRVTEIPGQNST